MENISLALLTSVGKFESAMLETLLQVSALSTSARTRSRVLYVVSFVKVPRRSYGTIGFIRGTLQGAKKNSSRKASTFRQVTTKRTCERGGAGWQGWSPSSGVRVMWSPSVRPARDCGTLSDYLLDHVHPGSMVGQCGWLYVFWWAGEESWRVLTIRTCASRRNRATKDQLPPFSIPPSTVNDGITDRGTTHNVAARTSRLADVRSGDHARLRMKNLAGT